MGLKIVTPPTVAPISVVGMDLLKLHLQEAIDVSDEDALIESMLNAAWDLAEKHTWRQFLTASYRFTLFDFAAQYPDLRVGRRTVPLMIPRAPCRSIDSVKYRQSDGTQITMALNTDYIIDDESDIWSIRPAYDKCWPCVRSRDPKAVEITFTAGYGTTAAEMPAVLLHAVKLQVGSWWLNREATDSRQHYELPAAAKACEAGFRRERVGGA